jgi:hypothetical protein
MSFAVSSALFAYLLTVVCSIVVSKRSSNSRIRLLALTVGLLPLCQALVLLGRHQILGPEVAETVESLELLVGALSLGAIHLLNRENADRRTTDKRLRVAEATPAIQEETEPCRQCGKDSGGAPKLRGADENSPRRIGVVRH